LDSYDYIREIFEKEPEKVFYGRQVEILCEDKHFHWKTNRGLRFLADNKKIGHEKRKTAGNREISLYWHKSYRYYKTGAKRVIDLVETFSDVAYSGDIGAQDINRP